MNRGKIFEKLTNIFQIVFDDDSLVIGEKTTAADIEEWDSFEHVRLIVAIENNFQIKFNMIEMSKFKNVGEMVDAIESKL